MYKKDINLTTLTFVVRDRLVIMVEGKNMTPAEVESAAKKLQEKIS
jgi:acyl-coenzyme A synthetase/AMP-(fatty) acid ligase